ncbi:DUF4350 domain-containing protein [Erythrobacter litoralis]|uniref:DUF4350 domain-containing protein n=1 Tax=Erythrobacter litoralis (strain HTCC2594) TaxID=314225 RepID=Q2N839_ERYLH|nr:DUF4350 domain-containing protein [Erythrobacter litoralis]ABC64152.1 hypothetical protein ELI_10300 [Erythrobacter litoralis HTCC2594]
MATAPALAPVAASAQRQAFGKRGVLALVGIGTLAFIALLYLIGTGQMTGPANNGQAHAASNGLTGYAALVQMLEAEGHDVRLSRSEAALDDTGLLVLTPPAFTDAEELATLVERRRYTGPTLIILPKWNVMRASGEDGGKPGWVHVVGAGGSSLTPVVDGIETPIEVQSVEEPRSLSWRLAGGALAGVLPESKAIQHFDGAGAEQVVPLVRSGDRVLAGYFDGPGSYADLAELAGVAPRELEADGTDGELWNVTIVAEPDLFNNWGMADAARADLAHRIVDAAAETADQPVVFDLTLNGLGGSRNLLSLAFEPPFLAATLCLIMALLLVGWRAFRRFGPATADAPALAFGKAQLVENGAGVIQRTRRVHLLTRPYAGLVERRLAKTLGLRRASREAIDAALAQRGLEPATPRLAALESARHHSDIIRAARALASLERTLSP